ncbi:DUF948 domain-containing protein [Cohnella nanjingensis]|uniref:DUF948 domain-containing protein n=1 Tax=Cohnella nanjingensis TaxID=1387779 RepID=A0A7X0RRV0_9BACL|nr:DUF948 domain-containing protein [Cohnella nanjingensis]MBB6672539.1 DUF948 domain-containing protein [Cohnella nanjingensis]
MSNQELMAWSVVLIAISFAALCVYLIATLKAARQTLLSVQSTVKEAGDTVESMRGKVEELTENVKTISEDVKNKIRSTNEFFQAARNAGVTLKETTGAVREISGTLTRAVRDQVAALEEQDQSKEKPWVAWLKAGMKVVSAVRSARRSAEEQEEQASEAYVPEPFQPRSGRVYNGQNRLTLNR